MIPDDVPAPGAGDWFDDAPPVMNAAVGIALERQFLDQLEQGRRDFAALLWRPTLSLAAPAAIVTRHAAGIARWQARHPDRPAIARTTGGTACPLSPGTLVMTLGLRNVGVPAALGDSYQRICHPVICALAELGIESGIGSVPGGFCDGAWNVTVAGRKIAGTAQRWRALTNGPGGFVAIAHAAITVFGDLKADIESVNQFNAAIGVDRRVDEAAHVRLLDLLGADQSTDAGERVIQELAAALRRALARDDEANAPGDPTALRMALPSLQSAPRLP